MSGVQLSRAPDAFSRHDGTVAHLDLRLKHNADFVLRKGAIEIGFGERKGFGEHVAPGRLRLAILKAAR